MADQALKYIADAEKLGPKIEGVAVQPVEIKKVGIIGSGFQRFHFPVHGPELQFRLVFQFLDEMEEGELFSSPFFV